MAEAAPDIFYLHDTNTTGITPSGKYMNTTVGTGGSTLNFDATGSKYWYADATWPTGNDDATIAAGAYDLNMYFAARPGAGSGDYPVVAGTNTSTTTTASTSHTLSLPGSISSGDLLIAMLASTNQSSAINISWPSGWTEFYEADASAGSGHHAQAGAYRQADGTEGSTISVTTNVSVTSSHNAYRITGAEDPATQAPSVATAAFTSNASSIDPPNLAPSADGKDYLWLAVASWRRTDRSLTGIPTNYTDTIQSSDGGGNTGSHLASVRRSLFAASENPGVFSISGNSNRRIGVTIAVHPAASVDIQVTVSHTASDGSGATTIVSSSNTTIDATTTDPYTLSIGSGALQTFTSADVRRLRVEVDVVSVSDGGNFVLDYDGGSGLCSNLSTPVVVVPELGLLLLPIAILLPPLMLWRLKKRKRTNRLAPSHG